MSLYLGNQKIKINSEGNTYCLNSFNFRNIIVSQDNHILKDLNGIYLTTSEETIKLYDNILSSDNYILKDLYDLYLLTIKEEK